MLTDAELKQMRERCDKATPGPWVPFVRPYQAGWSVSGIATADTADTIISCAPNAFGGRPGVESDRDFIAHARADIPRLLDEIDRLAGRVAELEAELAETPPTLEWLRQQFGEPEKERLSWIWKNGLQFEGGCFIGETPTELTTRAAVLAAVKQQEGGGNVDVMP